jgi:hypothetical protein
MMKLEWQGPMDAELELKNLDELQLAFGPMWAKTTDILAKSNNPEAPPKLLIEIWPDTGRIILIPRRKREAGRLVLTIPLLEGAYYELPNGKKFEAAYDKLVAKVIECIKGSLSPKDCPGVPVTVRNCDDQETEIVLRG